MEIQFVDAFAILMAGAIVPFITAIFTNVGMSDLMKNAIAILVSVICALVFAIGSGWVAEVPATFLYWLTRVVVFIAVIIPLAQGYYRAFKPVVKDIESKTGYEQ